MSFEIDVDSKEIPRKILSHVITKKTALTLDNAMQYAEFHDDVISMNEIKSVCCLPVLTKKSFLGVFYLENSLQMGEFNEQKTERVSVLSSICAISVENALSLIALQKMKRELEQKVKDKTHNFELEQKRRIEEVNEYRLKMEEFINKICHEIRNPLNGILGSLVMAEEESGDLSENNGIEGLQKKYGERLQGFVTEDGELTWPSSHSCKMDHFKKFHELIWGVAGQYLVDRKSVV